MPNDSRTDIEQSCARLLASFYSALDGRRNEEVLGAFHADGVWHRMGDTLTGLSAIGTALADRFHDTVVLHSLTGVHFTVANAETATSRAVVIVYVGKPDPDGGPAKGSLRAVTEASTEYIFTDGGWRIHRHDGRPLMMIEDHMRSSAL